MANGSAKTLARENDTNAVVAPREVAKGTITPEYMRERLIHSQQENVEVDEPGAAPLRPQHSRSMLGCDNPAIYTTVDIMTEEALWHSFG